MTDETILDHYLSPIEVGSKVAFNYSGMVRIGVVEKITPRKQYSWSQEPQYIFHVQQDTDFPKNASKVTDRRNLVVIG